MRETRYRAGGWLDKLSPDLGVIWLAADWWLGRRPPGSMPQLEDGVRHGLEVSRFPDFWLYWGGGGDTGILPKGPWHVQRVTLGVEFGSLAAFSPHPSKRSYVPLGHRSGSVLWLQLCNIWAS